MGGGCYISQDKGKVGSCALRHQEKGRKKHVHTTEGEYSYPYYYTEDVKEKEKKRKWQIDK